MYAFKFNSIGQFTMIRRIIVKRILNITFAMFCVSKAKTIGYNIEMMGTMF
jgi:hypothetical protein